MGARARRTPNVDLRALVDPEVVVGGVVEARAPA